MSSASFFVLKQSSGAVVRIPSANAKTAIETTTRMTDEQMDKNLFITKPPRFKLFIVWNLKFDQSGSHAFARDVGLQTKQHVSLTWYFLVLLQCAPRVRIGMMEFETKGLRGGVSFAPDSESYDVIVLK